MRFNKYENQHGSRLSAELGTSRPVRIRNFTPLKYLSGYANILSYSHVLVLQDKVVCLSVSLRVSVLWPRVVSFIVKLVVTLRSNSK